MAYHQGNVLWKATNTNTKFHTFVMISEGGEGQRRTNNLSQYFLSQLGVGWGSKA